MNKSKKEVRLLDKELNKFENFGLHSPEVGKYLYEKTSLNGPKYTIGKTVKYQEPKQKVELAKNLPHSYLDIYSSRKTETTNFPKQDRFRWREIAEKEIGRLPCPNKYNLQELFSIHKNTQLDVVKKIRTQKLKLLSSSYSRFDDSVFYPEKERLMKGNDSVSPDKYDVIQGYKYTRAKRPFH